MPVRAKDQGSGAEQPAQKDYKDEPGTLLNLLRIPVSVIVTCGTMVAGGVAGYLHQQEQIYAISGDGAQFRAEIDSIVQRVGFVIERRDREITDIHNEINKLQSMLDDLRSKYEAFASQGSRYTQDDAARLELRNAANRLEIEKHINDIDKRIAILEVSCAEARGWNPAKPRR
jgi:chromosome segregation ATPase